MSPDSIASNIVLNVSASIGFKHLVHTSRAETGQIKSDVVVPECLKFPYNLITFVEDRPGHDQRYAMDATRLETELGWCAQETFETGIAKTIDWYLANSNWWEPLRRNVYAGERLGLLQEAKARKASEPLGLSA